MDGVEFTDDTTAAKLQAGDYQQTLRVMWILILRYQVGASGKAPVNKYFTQNNRILLRMKNCLTLKLFQGVSLG